MHCPECGESLESDDRYCRHCGVPVAGPCGTCGHANPAGSVYCGGCGETIGLAESHLDTLALVLLKLDHAPTVSRLLAHVPDRQVAPLLRKMRHAPTKELESQARLLQVGWRELKALGGQPPPEPEREAYVVRSVANVDGAHLQRILGILHEDDPEFAEAVQNARFTFDDLVLLDSRAMQDVLKEIPQDKLVLAMKTAGKATRDAILAGMSQRAGEMLMQDVQVIGPVLVSDVERAQKEIARVVRRLEEEGRLALIREGQFSI